ncbi:hypothetical protein GCM10010302_02310 [Streptomyces polychromogenes]|uniref:Uncharacterized protein n=1 Tax=Streptomyces polychromogenes TaxID=67342 RepID=A0ABP3EL11_9ACTN
MIPDRPRRAAVAGPDPGWFHGRAERVLYEDAEKRSPCRAPHNRDPREADGLFPRCGAPGPAGDADRDGEIDGEIKGASRIGEQTEGTRQGGHGGACDGSRLEGRRSGMAVPRRTADGGASHPSEGAASGPWGARIEAIERRYPSHTT